MSNTFSALIVPATIAQEEVIRQLLLYVETVFLYAPSENNHLNLSPELQDFCQQYAPVPFGEFLTNFEQLMHDMTSHRTDYYGGRLSSLSAKASSVDEESVWRLIKRLSAGTADTAQQETLFQARLLLKLAELRDQEEKEITQTLTDLDARSQTLLHGLTNGDEDDASEIRGKISQNQQPAGDSLDKRLQAWAHLFMADPRREEHWLLAAPQEVLAILSEYATTSINETPALILSLPLPRMPLKSLNPSQYRSERTAWQTATHKCQILLRTAITTAARTGDLVERTAIEQDFQSHLKQFNDWSEGEQDSLDFWLLPLSLTRLFAKITRKTAAPTSAQSMGHCVVAVPRLNS